MTALSNTNTMWATCIIFKFLVAMLDEQEVGGINFNILLPSISKIFLFLHVINIKTLIR